MDFNNELYHHGIKGMKWGVRRYQNSDGSLTPAGKKRYDRDIKERPGYKKVAQTKMKDVSSSETEEKKISELSDEELNKRINRIMLEKRYSDLVDPTPAVAKTQSRGKKFVLDVLETSGKNIATQATTYAMGAIVNKLAKKIGSESDIVNPRKGQKDK